MYRHGNETPEEIKAEEERKERSIAAHNKARNKPHGRDKDREYDNTNERRKLHHGVHAKAEAYVYSLLPNLRKYVVWLGFGLNPHHVVVLPELLNNSGLGSCKHEFGQGVQYEPKVEAWLRETKEPYYIVDGDNGLITCIVGDTSTIVRRLHVTPFLF